MVAAGTWRLPESVTHKCSPFDAKFDLEPVVFFNKPVVKSVEVTRPRREALLGNAEKKAAGWLADFSTPETAPGSLIVCFGSRSIKPTPFV